MRPILIENIRKDFYNIVLSPVILKYFHIFICLTTHGKIQVDAYIGFPLSYWLLNILLVMTKKVKQFFAHECARTGTYKEDI